MPLLLSLSQPTLRSDLSVLRFCSLARPATGVYRKLWGTSVDPQYID